MKVSEIIIKAGLPQNSFRPTTNTDDAIVTISSGEVNINADFEITPGDSLQVAKFIELVEKINRIVEEHNKSL